MKSTREIARFIVWAAIIGCTLATAGLLSLPLWLTDETLSPETGSGITLLSGTLLIIAGGIMIWRAPVINAVQRTIQDTYRAIHQLRQNLRHWLKAETRIHKLLLLGFVFLAFALRLLYISQPMRTDESLTYLEFASHPVYLALTDYAAPNNHLLHTFGVWISTRLFGNSEWAIRLTAFLSGVALVPITYVTVRSLYRKDAGLLAAGLVAVSSVMIAYSTNARGYTLQANLLLLSILLITVLVKSQNRGVWMAFVCITALGFYTIPTMLYFFGGIMLWWLILIWSDVTRAQRLKRLLAWVSAGFAVVALTLLLYAPVLIVSGVNALIGNIYVESRTFEAFLADLPVMLRATWIQWQTGLPTALSVALVLGFVASLVLPYRFGKERVPVVLPLLIWIIIVLLVQRVTPFTRIWLPLLPLFFGMGAAGLILALTSLRVPLRQETLSHIVIIALVTVSGWQGITGNYPYETLETGTFRDAEAVTTWLNTRQTEESHVIYQHPSGESLRYYFLRQKADVTLIQRDFRDHPMLYVIVNHEYSQTVETVMAENNLRPTRYGTPQTVAEFERATIYRLPLLETDSRR